MGGVVYTSIFLFPHRSRLSENIKLILILYSVCNAKKFMKCNSCTPISVMKDDDLEPFTKSHGCAKHVRVCNGAYYM